MPNEPTLLVTTIGIRDHFRDQVQTSLKRQHVAVNDGTAGYLVDLLTRFADPRSLFSDTAEGPALRALADHYADAAHAEGAGQRKLALKALGDVALFVNTTRNAAFQVALPGQRPLSSARLHRPEIAHPIQTHHSTQPSSAGAYHVLASSDLNCRAQRRCAGSAV